jgi:ketosteroid isomerase-like protein
MSDNRHIGLKAVVMGFFLFSSVCFAQNRKIEPAAQAQIDAGNQAWIDGMKQGNVPEIAATYTESAVDCDPAGNCIRGRAAIEQHMADQLGKLGRAQSASVASMGSVQQGKFVYEWGRAVASFANGKKVVDRYLTAWQRQPDGSWKIFRNMVIPPDEAR